MRSATMFFWTSEVPPAIEAAPLQSHCRCHLPPPATSWAPRQSGAAAPHSWTPTAESALGHVGPGQLHPAGLGSGFDAPGQPRQRPPVVEAQDLQVDERLGEPVGDLDVVERAGGLGEAEQLVEVHLVDDLFLEGEDRAALVRQRGARHRPALVEAAEELIGGHEDLVEEHLVELGFAGELHQGSDVDAGGSPCRRRGTRCRGAAARRGRCGPGRCPSGTIARSWSRPSGPRPASRPRPGWPGWRATARSEPAPGSENSWHHSSLASRIDGQPAPLLLVGAEGEDGRADVVHADPVDRLGRARARAYSMFKIATCTGGRATASVLDRPVDADPVVAGQRGLPGPTPAHLLVERREARRGLEVGGQPGPDLVGERVLVGR